MKRREKKEGGWKMDREAAAFLEISGGGGFSDSSYASACLSKSKEHQKNSLKNKVSCRYLLSASRYI